MRLLALPVLIKRKHEMLTPEQARMAAEAHIVKYCGEVGCTTEDEIINALTALISRTSRAIEKYSSNDEALNVLEHVSGNVHRVRNITKTFCLRCGDDVIGADVLSLELHGACIKCLGGEIDVSSAVVVRCVDIDPAATRTNFVDAAPTLGMRLEKLRHINCPHCAVSLGNATLFLNSCFVACSQCKSIILFDESKEISLATAAQVEGFQIQMHQDGDRMVYGAAPKVDSKPAHSWDHGTGEGDTCVKCGDKDHTASEHCSESKSDNSYHWHYLTFGVDCTDGTKSVCEIPLASSVKRVRYADIEECRKLAISITPLSDYAAIQSVCYLGFMAEVEFSTGNGLRGFMVGN